MPPKRRGRKAPLPKKRTRREDKEGLPNKEDEATDPEDIASLKDLWHKLSSREERPSALHRAVEETAALRLIVWPHLCKNPDDEQASNLVAQLVSWEHREGVHLDTALDFVNDAAVWERVCQTIFDRAAEIDDFEDLAVVTHFATVAWASAQLHAKKETILPSIEKELSSWNVWHSMPSRIQALWMKRETDLADKIGSVKPSRPPFVVTVVFMILRLAEGDRLKLHGAAADEEDPDGERYHLSEWTFLHRSLELLTDLLSSHWETRRILIPFLDAVHFTVRCRLALGSAAASRAEENMLLTQHLLSRLDSCQSHPIDLATGQPMSYVNVRAQYHRRASIFQKLCHRHFPDDLPDIIYSGVGLLCQTNHSFLREAMGGLSDENLLDLLERLRLVDKTNSSGAIATHLYNREFLFQVLEHHLTIPNDPMEELQNFPLYPTEQVLWDFARIPPSHYSLIPPSHVLSLPKLQTRFLSFADYLWRNFELLRLESAYDIRSNIVDAVKRVRPVVRQSQDLDANEEVILKTGFNGWARMALELSSAFKIVKVEKPPLGGLYPSKVLAEVTIDLQPCGASIRREWDSLGEFDNIFLVGVDARRMTGGDAPLMSEFHRQHGAHRAWDTDQDHRVPDEDDRTFPRRYGVTIVRGCMIVQIRDEEGNVLNDPASGATPAGTRRTFVVAMDPTQYSADARSSTGTTCYNSFNLVIRRHGRENNFKAVLETIRGLMVGTGSINRVLPSFLQGVLLGQASPDSASYRSETVRSYSQNTVGVEDPDSFLDFGDTFVSEDHLRSSFEGAKIEIKPVDDQKIDTETSRYNYRVRIVQEDKKSIVVATPYAFSGSVQGNLVPFTPVQVEAIRSGLCPGLTLIQGPPGTGKTDTAVQIIANLYHSFPNQRTVVITHSNAALNDIFEKVVTRGDIDEKNLIRLGSGERDLQVDSTHDFTKVGRVAYCFKKRGELLERVQKLSETLGLSGKAERGADGSPGYTCESAQHLFCNHIMRLVRKFEAAIGESKDDSVDPEVFPFSSYLGISDTIPLAIALKHIEGLKNLFEDLAAYRPLELLRTQKQRTDYLLSKQTRIVAMTCTHAAIARSQLIELGFEYDNVVVEEAGQMVEVEGFIPLLLQRGAVGSGSDGSYRRLKRICLMGDHNQLPPVVKNMTFSKFSNLDQSIFTRLIRLGVPHVQLDKQGRARPDIANLYNWRYSSLGNLPSVVQSDTFKVANAGFKHTMQFVDVGDFQGKGESSPTAYFYQNVGEAEYVVALFQYMVLIGYGPKSISILTTYNGQKSLIEDILSQRCGDGTPMAGLRPRAVSTVDQYQGQQNDFVLLSLVRTRSVGHLRDVRRLVVALSRGRLGLYVFGRKSLFDSVHELKPAFEHFDAQSTKLELIVGETYPCTRKVADEIPKETAEEIEDVSQLGSIVHEMQEDFVNQMSNEQEETA